MKLLTEQIEKTIPKLYAQENEDDPIVYVKFFNPIGAGTWYITEYDGDDTFFGWADLGMPDCAEFGYISKSELESIRLPLGMSIERDRYFSPAPLSEFVKR